MGITKFLLILLSSGLLVLSFVKDNSKHNAKQETRPLVEFYKATAYTINKNEVEQLIQADKTFLYNNSKQLYNASVVLRDKNIVDTINANYIKQKNNIFYLKGDIYLENTKGLSLKTQSLIYDMNRKNIYNNHFFTAVYLKNIFTGKKLFYDINSNKLKANDIKFNINLKGGS